MTCHPVADDPRYTVDLEHCGYETPRHVVRFCGDWVGQMTSRKGAELLAQASHEKRRQAFAAMLADLEKV